MPISDRCTGIKICNLEWEQKSIERRHTPFRQLAFLRAMSRFGNRDG
ncbi:MAG: hypothetical protein M3Y68_12060 [Chloroflexota bacterium]|nr:hypothetical protein [Chloroflexota bacterium]